MGRHFLWDPIEDNIVEEFDDAGNRIADYTTEPFRHGTLISQHRDGVSRFHHFDGQGNTTSLTDKDGNVTDTYGYKAFCEVPERTGSTVNPFQYFGQQGYYRDAETGDYEVRRRPLEYERWFTPDPIEVLYTQWSAYIHAFNNPLMYYDPSGFQNAVLPNSGWRPRSNTYLSIDETSERSVRGRSGSIEYVFWIDADYNNILPGRSGFVPNARGVKKATSDPNFVGVLGKFVDTQRGKTCGPNNQGVRAWFTAYRMAKYSANIDGKDIPPDVMTLQKWCQDEYFGILTKDFVIGAYHRHQAPGKQIPAYFDFPGYLVKKGRVEVATGHLVAILCVCPNDHFLVLNDGKPLDEFYYTEYLTVDTSKKQFVSSVTLRLGGKFGNELATDLAKLPQLNEDESGLKVVNDCC